MAGKTVSVEAPDRAFQGLVAGIQFTDGKAKFVRADHEAAYQYFQSAGYTLDGERLNALPPRLERAEPSAAAPGTPENPDGIVRGAPPKDAAVDKDADGPVSDAFLPPTNAGEADPHGPAVVSPGLHAVPPAPIRPGEVHVGDEVARQELEETDLARAVLVEGAPATVVATTFDPDANMGAPATVVATTFDPDANMGPLGLSDPGSVEAGIRGAEANPSAADIRERAEAANEPPTRSDKVGAWRDYAVAQGATPEEAAELTKDQLIERYGA